MKKAFSVKIKNEAAQYLTGLGGQFPGELTTDLLEDYFTDFKGVPELRRRNEINSDGYTQMHITLETDVLDMCKGPSKKYNCIGQYIELAVNYAKNKAVEDVFIDPDTLRPGNAINCNGVNTVVEQVRRGSVKVQGAKNWAVKYDLKGVEITPEELSTLDNNKGVYKIDEIYLYDIVIKEIYSLVCDCNAIARVQYVHQMQNFIADNTNSKLEYRP
jgi:hypothetical protein